MVGQQASPNPKELVQQAVDTELSSPFLTENCTYQYHRGPFGKQETRLMIKSSDLVVGKLIRVGEAPVSEKQEQREDQQLRHLLESSHEQQEQRRRQQKFEGYARALVKALPDAFHFTETGAERGPQGQRLIHLSFQPSAEFKPASTDQELLKGMAGTMIIDETKKQIVRLEALLIRDIDFGFGVLVHLNKGGNLLLDRESTNQTAPNVRVLSVNLNGRLLLLKKLEIHWSFDHFAYLGRALDLESAVGLLTAPALAGYAGGLPSR
jgi:hypothetical protein